MDRVFTIDVSRSTTGPELLVYLGESPAFRIQGAGSSDVIYLHVMTEPGAIATLESIIAPGVPVDLAGLVAGVFHYEIWKAANNRPTLLSRGRLFLTDATAPVLGPIAAPFADGNLGDLNLTEGVAITPIFTATDFTGSGMTFALAPSSAALPSGLSLSSSGVLSGTPGTATGPISIVIRATNAGGFADSAFSIEIAAAPVPITFDSVVVLGASIVEQSFGRDLNTANAAATALLDAAGASGVPVYGYGFSGERIADATAEIDTIFAAHPGAMVVVHTGGNNVTSTRPYATATAGELSGISADYDALIAKAAEYPERVYIGALTFRTYGAPAADAAPFQDPALGSKPYNENILLPKLAASTPYAMSGGRPIFDLYRYTLSDFETWLENDGIHPNTTGEAALRDFITARAADVILGNPVSVLTERVYSIAAPVTNGSLADLNLTDGTPIGSISVASGFTGSGMTFALAPSSAALPSGLSLSSSGILSGTPDTVGGPVSIVIRATNASGFADSAFSIEVAAAQGPAPTLDAFVNFALAPFTSPANVNLMDSSAGSGNGEQNAPASQTGIDQIALVNIDGAPSGVSLRTDFSGPGTGNNSGYGMNTDGRINMPAFDGSTVYARAFTEQSFYVGVGRSATHVFTGLTPGASYTIDLIASRNSTQTRRTLYTFSNGETAQLQATQNPVDGPASVQTVADGSGEIAITQSNIDSSWSYIGGLRIRNT